MGRGRKIGLIVLVVAILAKFWPSNPYASVTPFIDGQVAPGYEELRMQFIKNFLDGWEREGAALAVYRDGKKVVDLWGGYAERATGRNWTENTITLTFSTTKGVAALCIARLVDLGRLKYDDPIAKHWKGFGKNGKEKITVQMALSHMAGLAYVDAPITNEHIWNHEEMRVLLENESPKWTPGEETGYHAFTYGWIVDQIVRHADEKHRSIGQFFREEFSVPLGIDFHIGLPTSEEWRVARHSDITLSDALSEVFHDSRAIKYFLIIGKFFWDSPLKKMAINPTWLPWNNVDYHHLEQAAALGIGSARSLAKLFDQVATGKLFGPAVNAQLQKWTTNKTDVVLDETIAKGNGLFFYPLGRAGTKFTIGHSGNGCQEFRFDPKNRLSFAYVTNGLKMGGADVCRTYARLEKTLYDIVEKEGRR